MYCNFCGKLLPEDANLCAYCGKRVFMRAVHPKLTRPRSGRKIAGVCAGLAAYFDADVFIVRLLCVIVTITLPLAVIGYAVAWVVLPDEPLRLTSMSPQEFPGP